ncbi:MAG: hypothetical protein RH862_07220 [Leptospiraceae bacterium]
MTSFLRFLLKRYRGLLWKAHTLLRDALKSENPDSQAEFIGENYEHLFYDIDSVSTEVQQLLDQTYGANPIPESQVYEKTYLRHSLLLLDAVDRNLKQLKDRALKDVFQKHVGDHIRLFLKGKDH